MKHYIILLAIIASNMLACANDHTKTTESSQEEIELSTQPAETVPVVSQLEEDSSEITSPNQSENATEINQISEVSQRPVAAKEVVIPVKESQSEVKVIEKNEESMKIKDNPAASEQKTELVIDTAMVDEAKQEAQPEVKEIPEPVPAFSHAKWDELVRKYVSASGKVNYKGFKSERTKFNSYLKELSDNPPSSSWSKNKRLAYWINVYNAFTVDLIVRNYPLKSIRDLNAPWKTPFFKIGTRTLSLNDVEHEIIRKEFNEARIHFAVNCASFSCPSLLNRAYSEGSLNSQLDRQTRNYINNPAHNVITGRKAEVSQLFNWYADDFKKDAGTVKAFINKYANTKIGDKVEITFKEYGWSLNE